jgi:hypothetical protein
MPTFNTKATISKDHELEVRLPTHLAQGEYAVVVKVSEHPESGAPREPLTFGTLHLGAMKGETFRREDIYGDDGR